MNQENLKFLQDRLFYLGTEKRLHPELEKNLAEGKPDFTLAYSNHIAKDKISATFHFRKSDNADMYFLNRYDATLQKPAQESKTQTFYLDNGKGVTMKEAYNLLDGRAVNKDLKNKEGVAYNAWVKLDFDNLDGNKNAKLQQYHKNYGYDLNLELSKLPIIPMKPEDMKQISSSLERGNLQQIILGVGKDAAPLSLIVAANPQYKTLDFYDNNLRPFSKEEKQDLLIQIKKAEALAPVPGQATMNVPGENRDTKPPLGQEQAASQKVESGAKKQDVKKNELQAETPGLKGSKKGVKKENVSTLLPKKSNSHKKGISL